jgi:hypothetical protein
LQSGEGKGEQAGISDLASPSSKSLWQPRHCSLAPSTPQGPGITKGGRVEASAGSKQDWLSVQGRSLLPANASVCLLCAFFGKRQSTTNECDNLFAKFENHQKQVLLLVKKCDTKTPD